MINRLLAQYSWLNYLLQILVIFIAAISFGVSLNIFLIPGDIYSGGVTGIAQLITYTLNTYTPYKHIINTGTLYFILNVPLILLSFYKLGQRFTLMTLIVVAASTVATHIIPINGVSDEPLLNAIVGGSIGGFGGGLTIKYGMSGGGFDIISMVINRATGMNIGSLTLILNSIVIIGAGLLYSWEFALFTLISMYVSARVINAIHTNEQRLTAFIVTDKVDVVVNSIYQRIHRGITIINGQGGYSKEPRNILMIVVNRYELYDLQMAVNEKDPHAFINIIQSTKVAGNFLNRQQQDKLKKDVKNWHPEEETSVDTVTVTEKQKTFK